MKTFKIFIIGLMMLPMTVFAQNKTHGVGNGGGIICISGVCKTLVESGLSMSLDYPDFWLPEAELVDAVKGIISHFPISQQLRTNLFAKVFLNLTHFKKVVVVDPAKLNQVTQFYIDTISKTDPLFDLTNFKLAALSSDNTTRDPSTFLLPEFFSLTLERQAQILIHEGLYRGEEASKLKQILQLESALANFYMSNIEKIFLNGVERDTNLLKKNINTVLYALNNLGLISKGELFYSLLKANFEEEVIIKYVKYSFSNYFENGMFKDASIHFVFNMTGKDITINKTAVLNKSMDSRLKVLLLNLDLSKIATVSKSPEIGESYISYNLKTDTWEYYVKYHGGKAYQIPNFSTLDFILPN